MEKHICNNEAKCTSECVGQLLHGRRPCLNWAEWRDPSSGLPWSGLENPRVRSPMLHPQLLAQNPLPDNNNTINNHGTTIARVHSVHVMNTEWRQVATDIWTKPTGLNNRVNRPTYKQPGNRIHHCHSLLLLSPKAETHFTVPPSVEGWVDLVAVTYQDDLTTEDGHPSKY